MLQQVTMNFLYSKFLFVYHHNFSSNILNCDFVLVQIFSLIWKHISLVDYNLKLQKKIMRLKKKNEIMEIIRAFKTRMS